MFDANVGEQKNCNTLFLKHATYLQNGPLHNILCLHNGKGKVKLYLCFLFNRAPCHEGILGEWRYSSTHSFTSALDGGEW
jgi:hypothetical protein